LKEEKFMQDRRQGSRHVVSFPIRVKWKNEDGKVIVEEGLTENVGLTGALVYLPRMLPTVGAKVDLTVTENTQDEVTVGAQVIRLERNVAHPQVALTLTEGMRTWKKKVWDLAAQIIAGQKPEELDDWS
jgi:putative aminopeptidase FrvX